MVTKLDGPVVNLQKVLGLGERVGDRAAYSV